MSYAKSAVFLLGLCFVMSANGNVADLIVPCHVNDNVCVQSSAEKVMPEFINGISELHISPLDPLLLKKTIDCSSGALKLKLNDLNVTGLKNSELMAVSRPEEYLVNIVIKCPINATGYYDADGTLFDNLAMYGSGIFELSAEIKFAVTGNLKSVEGKDGKQYLKIHKFDYEFEPTSKVTMIFNNLFNGTNVDKGEGLQNLINSSANELLIGLGKPVVKELVKVCADRINLLLLAKPKSEIELV